MSRPGPASAHTDDAVLGKAYDARLVRRLWTFVRPYRKEILLSLALLAAGAALELVQPLLLRAAIDRHIAAGKREGLGAIAIAFLAAVLGAGLVRHVQLRVMMMTGQKVVFDLRMALFARLVRLPSPFFDRNPVGRLITRLTSDIEGIEELFSSGVVAVAGDALKLLGIMVLMCVLDWKLALASFLVIPVMAVSTVFFRGRIRGIYRQIRQRLARVNAYLQENLLGIKVVKLFVQESRAGAEFGRWNREHRTAELSGVLFESAFSAYVELLSIGTAAIVVGWGGIAVLRGGLTFGTLVAFLDYVRRFFQPIEDMSARYTVLQSAMASSERVFGLLDTEPEREPRAPASPPRLGSAALAGVRFHYVEGETVLAGIDLAIAPGEKVALVGATGSGKTTLARLLARLYDVTEGRVTVDGTDVREFALRDLRRRIAFVFQDPFLFSGSIRENISLGDPAIEEGRVRRAAETAGASAFIEVLPGGYGFRVRERGSNLSAGQRQLLAFARALAADPEILVLDEATSSVDSETELRIQAALDELLCGRTALLIAHRLSTVRRADRIVVMHHGRIREQGTHETLLRQDGIYRRLVWLQMGAGEAV